MELGRLLHEAAYAGDVAELRRLAGQGVDLNVQLGEGRQTALHWAAFKGRVEAIRGDLQAPRTRVYVSWSLS